MSIIITSIRELQNYPNASEIWCITRSDSFTKKYDSYTSNVLWVPELSPSWDLFNKYRALVKNGTWNKESFAEVYVPQFLNEIKNSSEARHTLNELYKVSKTREDIVLCCFCGDEELCHRSIVAGLLQGVGVTVKGVKTDYSKCYDMYKEV